MKIALGSDHAGFFLKESLKQHLEESRNCGIYDFGIFDRNPIDYPEIALTLSESVVQGHFSLGVIVCGTGIGVAISANKIPGIRAAPCSEPFTARMSREHNDANILTLGSRSVGEGLARDIVDAFIDASFKGERHQRRVGKIKLIEEKYLK